jgi:flagellar FliJ protein
MKAFSLAGILRLRSLQETLAAADLAAARRDLDGVRARRTQVGAELAGTSVSAAGTAALAAIAAARASAQAMLSDLVALESMAARKADEAAVNHRQARTKAHTIERLRERFDVRERREDLRREQSALDEIAVTRAARRSAASLGSAAVDGALR